MIIASISHDKDCTCPRLIYVHRCYHWNNGSNNTFHNFFVNLLISPISQDKTVSKKKHSPV